MSAETLQIDSLGAQGDGVAHPEGATVFVPFTLPKEEAKVARVKDQATLISLMSAAPERIKPVCRHFGPDGDGGTCGGCSLQHAGDALYHPFKRDLVVQALKSKGIEAEVAPLMTAAPGERRRVVLTAKRTDKGLLLGYNQAQSHHVVDISECPIAVPGIVSRLGDLKRIAAVIVTGSDAARLTVTETLNGLDVSIEGPKTVGSGQRRTLTDTLNSMQRIGRVSLNGEILLEPAKPLLDFSGARVVPSPGAFTQATVRAEEAMAELAIAHIGKAKRIADLFAGIGTFSLRLARIGQVQAVESDGNAVQALDHAWRNTQGLKQLTAEKRDLFRRPLMTQELNKFDAVVFDPPRAGAEAQCQELARSKVKKIVAISCNPLTLARDLAILTAGGYKVGTVTPIDQFLWSHHVEAVATLTRR
ncbi:class I SAM-dependent RNA methyltransferase [Rhizobium halophytocola]|uniref:23S rRNA (Uracil1939-C5)-methyltransferase n=1 Tax=Rhizobium halophytocola TaxID=735519 RepID=A0ABS4DXG3_9HYPH|nr:class I SAM-dependent RNA methyltransferase [Rhizobium halophytocola]MBP1850360.1 23S rRNA (uracil1939-C5)-methyltransferase [Rhizobium halophytocola]